MISIEQLRVAARMRGSDAQDGYLKDLEKAAVDALNVWSGRYYGPPETGFVEHRPGGGLGRIILEELPNATTAVAVVEHVTPGDAGTVVVAGDTDGFVTRGRQLVRKGGAVWSGLREYEITYDRGYESGKEPARARQFVTGMVVYWFERRTPVPRVGEVHTFPVPLHLQKILGSLSRQMVAQ